MLNVSIIQVNGGFILQDYSKQSDYDPERYVETTFTDLVKTIEELYQRGNGDLPSENKNS